MTTKAGGTLFDTYLDGVLTHVDDLLVGRRRYPMTGGELAVLRFLRYHAVGKRNALSLARLTEEFRMTEREVKQIISDLRLHHKVQLGASRESHAGGYYLISSHEESVESAAPMMHQAVTMIRIVLALRGGRQEIDQMLTQLRLELESEDAK